MLTFRLQACVHATVQVRTIRRAAHGTANAPEHHKRHGPTPASHPVLEQGTVRRSTVVATLLTHTPVVFPHVWCCAHLHVMSDTLGHLQNVHKTLHVEAVSVHNPVSNFHKISTDVVYKENSGNSQCFFRIFYCCYLHLYLYSLLFHLCHWVRKY